ncbi:MAG: L-rhamnose mutarotase [Cytophagales bacterium]|nr:L-rhamnose mutarotase [Cytophagales bacterium]
MRIAFKMFLKKNAQDEYQKRHSFIWPELKTLLKDHGISEYYIFLDKDTSTLFASLSAQNYGKYNSLSTKELMKKWWLHMADLMETNDDNSPKIIELKEIFYLK